MSGLRKSRTYKCEFYIKLIGFGLRVNGKVGLFDSSSSKLKVFLPSIEIGRWNGVTSVEPGLSY